MRVYFDPTEVSFEELVRKFWAEHDPMPMAFTGTQYRSAVFVHSSEQREIVDLVRSELTAPSPFKTALQHTKTEPVSTFYRAEEYHQRFISKSVMSSRI